MGFTVLHIQKGSSSSGALGAHIDRTVGRERTYKNANPALKDSNISFPATSHCSLPLNDAINARIAEGYHHKKAIRKDAVKSVRLVLSGTHEDMKRIFSKGDTMAAWIKANADFVKKQYGQENIVRFVLHMDEKTPHLHVVIVPLLEDGTLSAKKVMGNRKQYRQLHTDYAAAIKEFGLERGIEKTSEEKPTHMQIASTTENYYQAVKEIEKVKKIDPKQLLRISPRDKSKLLQSVLDGEKITNIFEKRGLDNQQNRKI